MVTATAFARGFGTGSGRPPSIVHQVQKALQDNAIHIAEYFGVLHDVAVGEIESPVRQRVEAAVYLLNRHLGTPTSMIDVKSVSEARLSGADLLEIAQLVSQSMRRPVLLPHPDTTEPLGIAQSGQVDSPPEAQTQICET